MTSRVITDENNHAHERPAVILHTMSEKHLIPSQAAASTFVRDYFIIGVTCCSIRREISAKQFDNASHHVNAYQQYVTN